MDLVDDNSYLGGTHEQLTSRMKEEADVFLMSMWDIEKEFKLALSIFLDVTASCHLLYLLSLTDKAFSWL